MEREELFTQVTESIEADGKQLSPSLSEETINGELDDALEDIGEDEEANKKVIAKLAKRLLRMDGNLHSNVSKEVKEYKKKHPAPTPKPKNGKEDNEEEDDMPAWAKALTQRIDQMEESRKTREVKEAKDAVADNVKKGLKAKFKTANIEVNEYIFKQTLRDLEIPETEDGEKVNEDELIRKMERAYYKNLKDAGLGKEDTGKSRFGGHGGGNGESAADRFFNRKGKREGWKK